MTTTDIQWQDFATAYAQRSDWGIPVTISVEEHRRIGGGDPTFIRSSKYPAVYAAGYLWTPCWPNGRERPPVWNKSLNGERVKITDTSVPFVFRWGTGAMIGLDPDAQGQPPWVTIEQLHI